MRKNLKEIRKEIDLVDAKIVSLLEKRFLLALATKSLKKTTRDLKREREILAKSQKRLKNKLLKPYLMEIYSQILKQSVKFQRKNDYKAKQKR